MQLQTTTPPWFPLSATEANPLALLQSHINCLIFKKQKQAGTPSNKTEEEAFQSPTFTSSPLPYPLPPLFCHFPSTGCSHDSVLLPAHLQHCHLDTSGQQQLQCCLLPLPPPPASSTTSSAGDCNDSHPPPTASNTVNLAEGQQQFPSPPTLPLYTKQVSWVRSGTRR